MTYKCPRKVNFSKFLLVDRQFKRTSRIDSDPKLTWIVREINLSMRFNEIYVVEEMIKLFYTAEYLYDSMLGMNKSPKYDTLTT